MQETRVPIAFRGTLTQYLLSQYPLLTSGRLHKYLRENKIKVNSKKIPLNTALRGGEQVKIFLHDNQLFPPQGALYLQAKPHLTVCYEDDALLVVDKPAGVVVIDEAERMADTLQNRVLRMMHTRGDQMQQANPKLCHRLDTGTSGLVIFAKTEEALVQMSDIIRNREVEKEYLCVTFGRPRPASATLQGHLVKDSKLGHVQVRAQPTKDSKEITTRYKTLATSGRLALLSVELVTGRTHQIRAHMASIECPVLGDSKYGNNEANRELRLKYQALCAYRLTFPALVGACAGLSGKTLTVEKPWYCSQVIDGTLR